jgi:hypothetical protein
LCTVYLSVQADVIDSYDQVRGKPYKVTVDSRSILINGKRALLVGGVIHYPRSTPGMWDDIFTKAREEGLNLLQTYIFWNFHEREEGVYYFEERADIELFLQKAAAHGLFVNLRFGPYVDAEWGYGGLPLWLTYKKGMSFRCYNEPWLKYVEKWAFFIMDVVRPYLAENGGPIILSQVENEYNDEQQLKYVEWNGQLATRLNVNIPFIMCGGLFTNNTIESYNGCDGADWISGHWSRQTNTPTIWTENEGWFDQWGLARAIRTPEDVAYTVARWFSNGGDIHVYYMWFGGNHYESWGGAGVANMYANDVLLHSDATPNEPKYTHLAKLHLLVRKYAESILTLPFPLRDAVEVLSETGKWNPSVNGTQNARTFGHGSDAITFIENNSNITKIIRFNNKHVFIRKAYSVLILDSAANTLFDTSDVDTSVPNYNKIEELVPPSAMHWKYWRDTWGKAISLYDAPTPIEQLLLTKSKTDYLYYRTKVHIAQEGVYDLSINTHGGNALLLHVDDVYQGQNFSLYSEDGDHNITAKNSLIFSAPGTYELDILSVSLGLFKEIDNRTYAQKGITGQVLLEGKDITRGNWSHQVGLSGQAMQIYTTNGSPLVAWRKYSKPLIQSLMWFQTTFSLSHIKHLNLKGTGSEPYAPLLIDLSSMTRGHAYVNGYDIGRYWLIKGRCDVYPPIGGGCTEYDPESCNKPTQWLYHVPPDYLNMDGDNLLTLFEEVSGDPSQIKIITKVRSEDGTESVISL